LNGNNNEQYFSDNRSANVAIIGLSDYIRQKQMAERLLSVDIREYAVLQIANHIQTVLPETTLRNVIPDEIFYLEKICL